MEELERCSICGIKNIDLENEDSPHTYTINEITGNDEFLVHSRCLKKSLKVLKVQKKLEELQKDAQEYQERYMDVMQSLKDIEEKQVMMIDASTILDYLEEFITTETMRSHRAPKGSDFQKIAAFRSNDAEDIKIRIQKLLPEKIIMAEDE